MKFIADAMLGRLAKRLRLLGFDVLYDRTFGDNDIIRLSLEQHRVILTRDQVLCRRPLAANHLFIRHQDVEAQLEQVLAAYAMPEQRPLTRCSRCNGLLRPLPRSEARDLVPEQVYRRYRQFLQCEGCGKAYWTGTHVAHMGFREGKKR
jgi:uncharacterized protein with PIN domain